MAGHPDRIDFNVNDFFLIFNYTHTLQKIYQIPEDRVHYVHGECNSSEGDLLVVGHGNDNRIQGLREIIEELNDAYDYTQTSQNSICEYTALLEYIKVLRKDVGICMGECDWFYQKINRKVDCVNVYGMSFGEVDIPYFLQIKKKWPSAKWRFSYYSEEDKQRTMHIAKEKLLLNIDDVKNFSFSCSCDEEIQKEIIERQEISLSECV